MADVIAVRRREFGVARPLKAGPAGDLAMDEAVPGRRR
jgi:hypothetical protein